MAEVRATDTLREEHQSIRRVVAAMVVLGRKMDAGQAAETETLQTVVEFMRLASQIHERKEEEYLFPALEERGVPPDIAPIRSLVESHRTARALASRLEAAANTNAAGWMPLDAPVLESLRGLADLYPMHLWEEDMILYHMAERSLRPEDDARLLEGFRQIDGTVAGANVLRRFEELADTIEKRAW